MQGTLTQNALILSVTYLCPLLVVTMVRLMLHSTGSGLHFLFSKALYHYNYTEIYIDLLVSLTTCVL